MCCLSCQRSPYFTTWLSTFEERMCSTGSVRQVVPPDSRGFDNSCRVCSCCGMPSANAFATAARVKPASPPAARRLVAIRSIMIMIIMISMISMLSWLRLVWLWMLLSVSLLVSLLLIVAVVVVVVTCCAYIYIYMYVCMYVCIYIYICVCLHS